MLILQFKTYFLHHFFSFISEFSLQYVQYISYKFIFYVLCLCHCRKLFCKVIFAPDAEIASCFFPHNLILHVLNNMHTRWSCVCPSIFFITTLHTPAVIVTNLYINNELKNLFGLFSNKWSFGTYLVSFIYTKICVCLQCYRV